MGEALRRELGRRQVTYVLCVFFGNKKGALDRMKSPLSKQQRPLGGRAPLPRGAGPRLPGRPVRKRDRLLLVLGRLETFRNVKTFKNYINVSRWKRGESSFVEHAVPCTC